MLAYFGCPVANEAAQALDLIGAVRVERTDHIALFLRIEPGRERLDPTMSQNMIVSWRRSAEEVGVIGAVRACAEFACPQVRQMRGRAAPQCSQDLLPSFRLVLQLGHCIAAPSIAPGQLSISRTGL